MAGNSSSKPKQNDNAEKTMRECHPLEEPSLLKVYTKTANVNPRTGRRGLKYRERDMFLF